MYTNEEVRANMQELVDKKGPKHQGPAMYANWDGSAGCFLGALCEQMGVAIPRAGVRAQDVLGEGAVSRHMAAAFIIAQYMNDTGFRWGYILQATDAILQMDESDLFSGFRLSPKVTNMVDTLRAQKNADHLKRAAKLHAEMTAAVNAAANAAIQFKVTCNGVTFPFPAVSMPKQEDHALVA